MDSPKKYYIITRKTNIKQVAPIVAPIVELLTNDTNDTNDTNEDDDSDSDGDDGYKTREHEIYTVKHKLRTILWLVPVDKIFDVLHTYYKDFIVKHNNEIKLLYNFRSVLFDSINKYFELLEIKSGVSIAISEILDMANRLKLFIPNYFSNKFEIQRNKKIEKIPEIITVIPRIKEIKQYLKNCNYNEIIYSEEINEILLEDVEILKNKIEKIRVQRLQVKNESLENFKKTYKKQQNINDAQIADYIEKGLWTVNEYNKLGDDEEEIELEFLSAERRQNRYNNTKPRVKK